MTWEQRTGDGTESKHTEVKTGRQMDKEGKEQRSRDIGCYLNEPCYCYRSQDDLMATRFDSQEVQKEQDHKESSRPPAT